MAYASAVAAQGRSYEEGEVCRVGRPSRVTRLQGKEDLCQWWKGGGALSALHR